MSFFSIIEKSYSSIPRVIEICSLESREYPSLVVEEFTPVFVSVFRALRHQYRLRFDFLLRHSSRQIVPHSRAYSEMPDLWWVLPRSSEIDGFPEYFRRWGESRKHRQNTVWWLYWIDPFRDMESSSSMTQPRVRPRMPQPCPAHSTADDIFCTPYFYEFARSSVTPRRFPLVIVGWYLTPPELTTDKHHSWRLPIRVSNISP